MTATRCGLKLASNFKVIGYFDTKPLIFRMGSIISNLSEGIVRDIEKEIRAIQNERSVAMKPVTLDYQMTEQGFLEPVLEVSNNQLEIGKYGMRAMSYLNEEYPHRYSLLRAEGTLMETMYKVNEEAHQRMEVLQEQMLKIDPIPNPQNFYESYRHREMIRTRAEEIVLHEIVYKPR